MMQETLYIAPAELHNKMKQLKEVEHMDYLRSLTGMDWGVAAPADEESSSTTSDCAPSTLAGLGVVYHLESTTTGKRICVKTSTTDREHPHLPTVTDLWIGAELPEREVYDFFGIIFTGHPDMRRLFLREDWVGFPLRKDNNPEEENPLRMNNEETIDTT